MTTPKGQLTGYLAPLGFVEQLKAELQDVVAVYDRLILAQGPRQNAYWAQNIWLSPEFIAIESIKDAAQKLKDKQRNWCLYPYKLHRRAELIEQQLPHVSRKPLVFGAEAPRAPLGSWLLLEQGLMLASADCTSPFPNGDVAFVENKDDPPSRAYLKLWEVFTRTGRWPQAGERAIELGASPGGWTWVVAGLGTEVLAVDRAPLDPRVAAMPGVKFRKGNAFALKPSEDGPVDWFFSDVICYPEKLFDFVTTWLEQGGARNFVCTLKFQGPDHYAVIEKFAAVPGSELVHLTANKHELTWILIR